jgi:hypothetical protein
MAMTCDETIRDISPFFHSVFLFSEQAGVLILCDPILSF